MRPKSPLILWMSLFLYTVAFAQIKTTNTLTIKESDSLIHVAIQQKTDEIFDSLVAIRRDFHMYPELSGYEKNTSIKIADYLSTLGLEVKMNIGGYGVVGILKGAKKGKKIAWRADIDALASDIPDVVDFQSINTGVRHICGHDVHTTVALGIANILASQSKHLNGTVYFVFQPSEENIKGARAMIDDGLFDMIHPDEVYALHMSPFPVGTIATKAGGVYSDHRQVAVSFEKNSDSTAVVDFIKEQILSIQNIESPDSFNNPINLADPEQGITSPNTIYKDYISLSPNLEVEEKDSKITVSAYMSCSDQKQLGVAKNMLEQRIGESIHAKLIRSIDYVPVTYTILNDDRLVNQAISSISTIYGQDFIIPLYGVVPGNRSDDFALFQQQVPGVYFFLGGSNFETGVSAMPHAPNFSVDESCIKTGVQFFSSMIVERLNNK
jgi:metal-dependent amidase/aminoacylase/carboxypeptidase family protein